MAALVKTTSVQMSSGFTDTLKAVPNSFGHVEGISMRKWQYQITEAAVFHKITNGVNTTMSETKSRNSL